VVQGVSVREEAGSECGQQFFTLAGEFARDQRDRLGTLPGRGATQDPACEGLSDLVAPPVWHVEVEHPDELGQRRLALSVRDVPLVPSFGAAIAKWAPKRDEEVLQSDAVRGQSHPERLHGNGLPRCGPRRREHPAHLGTIGRRHRQPQLGPRTQPAAFEPGTRGVQERARPGLAGPRHDESGHVGHSRLSCAASGKSAGSFSSPRLGRTAGTSTTVSAPPAHNSRVRSAPGSGAGARTTW